MTTPATPFRRIARSGPTADGRTIKPEWLREMAETYSLETSTAQLWPEHRRDDTMGHVRALQVQETDEGAVELYASFVANRIGQYDNEAGQKRYASVEVWPNFAKSGKVYLGGVGLTDNPASLGTQSLQFSTRACEASDAIETTELNKQPDSPGFFSRLRESFTAARPETTRESTDMTDEQLQALGAAAAAGVAEAIAPLAEAFNALSEKITTAPNTTDEADALTPEAFAALQQQLQTLTEQFAALTAEQSGTDAGEHTGAAIVGFGDVL